jgi:hypothetical protein
MFKENNPFAFFRGEIKKGVPSGSLLPGHIVKIAGKQANCRSS